MKTLYKFWFHPEIATAIAQRYAHISLNNLLALQPPSSKVREMWESTMLDDLYISVDHLGKEPNQPPGVEFEVQVVQVSSNVPRDAVIELFRDFGGFYINSVQVPEEA